MDNQDNTHILHNFPIMIYWIDRKHIFQGCNLETCRNIDEMLNPNPKFRLKQPIVQQSDNQVHGLITFQLSHTSFIEHSLNGNMHSKITTDTKDPINNANLEFIFKNTSIAFWIMDKNGVFIDGNPAAWRAAGVNSAEAFVGKTLADFTNMHDRSLEKIEKMSEINTQVILTGGEACFIEHPMSTPQKKPSFMHQAAGTQRAIFDNNRKVLGIAGVSFLNDELTRNTKFTVPESDVAKFLPHR